MSGERTINVGGRLIIGVAAGVCLALYGVTGITNIALEEGGFSLATLGSARGQVTTLVTGTQWVEPLANDVFVYNTRAKQYDDGLRDIANGVNTNDGQPISVDLSLEISLERSKLGIIHAKYGPDWYENVILPKVRSKVRDATSSVSSDEIYQEKGKVSVANYIEKELSHYKEDGINVTVNLRRAQFTDPLFIQALEAKARASQTEITERRLALAAIETANGVANKAEGDKQRRIKEAEANREEKRLNGEGQRLEKEENAKGILAEARANAEGTRLQVQAYGDGRYYSQVKVAEAMGDNFQVWGIPTGAPGTSSIVGLDSIVGKAFGASK